MKYRTEQILRWLALVGMFIMTGSVLAGCSLGVALGFFLWPWPLVFTIGPYLSRSVAPHPFAFWKKSKSERVPQWVLALADQFGVPRPKEMRVKPGCEINAAVRGNIIYVTEGLYACMWTRIAKGIMAHEIAHLAQRKGTGMVDMMMLSLAVLPILIVGLVVDTSWPVLVGATFTILPVILPLRSRHLEYDADRRAAEMVGSDTMEHALEVFVDRRSWDQEGDTHPSIRKRLVRLRKVSR